jgi:hypothetical protein
MWGNAIHFYFTNVINVLYYRYMGLESPPA